MISSGQTPGFDLSELSLALLAGSLVLVVAVAPVTLALWERYGWWSFVGGMAVAAVVDLVSISTGSILVGFLNYLFVWASVHQLGYAWRDGALDGARRRLAGLRRSPAGPAGQAHRSLIARRFGPAPRRSGAVVVSAPGDSNRSGPRARLP